MARWVSVIVLVGLYAGVTRADDELLKFSPPPSSAEPIGSVSALAYFGLPSRMAERARTGHPVIGPSERELQAIFRQAVETAVARSPAVLRSSGEQQAAVSDVAAAQGQRWPQIDVGTQTRAVQFGNGSENDQGAGGVNVAVTTMLYDWGRVDSTIESRQRLQSAADENLVAEKENIGFEVVTTLVELGKQRIIGELSQDFANRMAELVKMLAGIVAVDAGRASELTQAKARLLQAQALRDAAQAKARDAEITLHKLVGERPVAIPDKREWNIRLSNLEGLLKAAQHHPTILQATAQAESAELEAQAVRASGLPQLNWVVSKNTAEDSLGREQPWQTNLNMTWGAFRGGSTRAAERAALQRADASRHETAQQRRDLEFKIRTADNDARTQLERAELYRNLSVESDRIREAFYLQWHHLGKRTLLDVLTAENDHYGNQVSEITNRFDGYQSILRQYASAGTLMQWLQGKDGT
ncbi:TolC family protein [Pseudomonas sp. HS6]|uniref:TolC family protein n=1 Tax=Pseudomonas sp. HS6 TaxID=2850559 RepID=UPI0020199F28|nr:TolC family protein [Pseudomonas sp. HS6]